jgi:uncharacterized membrane protein
MPVEWKKYERAPAQSGAFWHKDDRPVARVMLRPNRSLSYRGFAWFLLVVWGFLLLPLLSLLGTTALWAMLPFMLVVLLALWLSFRRNYRDGGLFEELTLWPDLIAVHRHNPHSEAQDWQANPYWVSLALHEEGGPVENYLTLKGAGREIELGAFLSPDERVELHQAVEREIMRAKSTPTRP